MEPDRPTRPGVPLGLKLVGLAVLLFLAWVAFSFVFSLVGRAFALLGYVIVAVIAFYVGRFSGRASRPDRD